MEKRVNKKMIGIAVGAIVVFAIGFGSGYKYKEYLIVKSLQELANAFSNFGNSNTNSSDTQQAAVADTQEEKDYIANSANIEVTVDEFKSYSDSDNRFNGKARSLKGTIKNTGEKTIQSAILLVVFLDANEKAVGEHEYDPLYNRDSYESVLLKPNYSNEFSFNTDAAPSEWGGKVQYRITDIKLGE